MATPYTSVYEFFLIKVSDYSFVKMTEIDLYDELEAYMKVAITKFRNSKVSLADRDEVNNRFNQTLSDEEMNILATLMLSEYLKPQIIASELMKQALSNSDYRIYSQANHIKEMLSLYKEVNSEASKLMADYSYYKGNLGDLK